MNNKFEKRMWENILENEIGFGDVEINEYHKGTYPCLWYGTFIYFSHLIEGKEHTYFFKIIGNIISYTKI